MKKPLSGARANFMDEMIRQSADILTRYAYRYFDHQPSMQKSAEKAVQDTYLKAADQIELLMQLPSPLGWLKENLEKELLRIKRRRWWQSGKSGHATGDDADRRREALLNALDKLAQDPRWNECEDAICTILLPDEADDNNMAEPDKTAGHDGQ